MHQNPKIDGVNSVKELPLSELCSVIGSHGFPAHLEGEDRPIRGVNTIEDAGEGEITFLSNDKYAPKLLKSKASAAIVKNAISVPESVSAVVCDDPYAAITFAIITLHGYRQHPKWGLSPDARVDPTAILGNNPNIAAGATIAAGARIGDDCTIYPGCYVGENVLIGNECILFPNTVIYDQSILGDRVTIHAGSVIGEDGLGYAPVHDKWLKIPQVGRAIIGNDVEIGANCTIDRATLGTTTIGNGTKFGNVIVVGHGTKVGPDCMFAGLVGIAGSAKIGRHVTLAGQVGVAGHITIGDDVAAAGQSGLLGTIKSHAKVFGTPARPIGSVKRSLAIVAKLPDWIQRIRDLERQVKELRAQVDDSVRS